MSGARSNSRGEAWAARKGIGARQARWLAEHGRDLFAPSKRPRKAESVGRNEPCPCGSGKKFKRCCLGRTS